MRHRPRRRWFLARPAMLTIAIAAVLAGIGVAPSERTPSSVPAAAAPAGIETIDHVIIVVQENRSFDHYFGTYPGADGIPRTDGRWDVCLPDPGPRSVRAALPLDHVLRRRRRAQPLGVGARRQQGQDGRLRRDRPPERQHVQAPSEHPPVPKDGARSGAPTRRDGVPHARRDPELLGVRGSVRPAGPDVRAERLVDAARAPVPDLRLVGGLLGSPRPDELYVGPERPRRRMEGRQRRPRPVRVDRHHVPAPRARRVLGLLRG